jgi:hypothetical protein
MFSSIPPELRTSQSAQIVINEPPRDVKGKKRAQPEPEPEEEEADHLMTSWRTKRRCWASPTGEGSSKDGEPLAESSTESTKSKVTGCEELFLGLACVKS